jgi:hypothetical protein
MDGIVEGAGGSEDEVALANGRSGGEGKEREEHSQ